MCDCDARHFAAYGQTSASGRAVVVDGICTCARANSELLLEKEQPSPSRRAITLRLQCRAFPGGGERPMARRIFHRMVVDETVERVIIRLPHGRPDIILPIIEGDDH